MTPFLRSHRVLWIVGAAVVSVAAVIAVTRTTTPPRANLQPPPVPAPAAPQARPQQPASTQTFALGNAEIDRLAKQANSGSGDAAYRLALYYETVRHDSAEAMRWMKASAENGNLGGMYGYATYLKESRDPADRATARTWLEKVAAQGDEVSKSAARRDLRALDAAKN